MSTATEVKQENPVIENLSSLADLASAQSLEQTITVIRKITAKNAGGKDEIVSASEDVFIRPLVFTQWLKGLKNLQNVIAALPDGGIDLQNPAVLALVIMQVLAEAQDDVMQFVSMATNRPTTFFDELELDEGIKIIQAVFEVNRDFFIQKIPTMLDAIMPGVGEKIKTALSNFGQIPSAS